MLDSLRARLLVWFTAVLISAITVFGTLVLFVVWRTRLADIDADLATRADVLVRALKPASDGTFDLALSGASAAIGDEAVFYHAVWTSDGAAIDRSDADWTVTRPAGPGLELREGRRELARPAAHGALVLVGRDLSDVRADLWSLAAWVALVGVGAAGLAALGGWALAAGALRPIRRISDTARAMVGGDFAARIPTERVETELGHLARALNEAFDRLHSALERQQRFTADASHELRTPLTTLSTELQWAMARTRTLDEYRESLAAMQRAALRMQGIVERLLALARADGARDAATTLALDEVTREAVADVSSLASLRQVTMSADLQPLAVVAPPDRIREAITNVLGNAVQYNVSGGRVDVSLRPAGGEAHLIVRDTGIGVSPEDLTRVFEPFFRADPARSRDAGGAGLGLAVARAIVVGAGGRISCASEPGRGTTIEITLPLADEPA